MHYLFLAIAIISEVVGSAFLQKSEGFTKPLPTIAMTCLYLFSFYCLTQVLKGMPLGMAYAIWAGLGIVLTAAVSAVVFRHPLDLPAFIGIGLIVCGVVVMNLFSRATGH